MTDTKKLLVFDGEDYVFLCEDSEKAEAIFNNLVEVGGKIVLNIEKQKEG